MDVFWLVWVVGGMGLRVGLPLVSVKDLVFVFELNGSDYLLMR